jgi:transcription elongation factor
MAMPQRRKPGAGAHRSDIKKEDTVKVIAGRDKGKTGRVLRVDRETGGCWWST